MPAWPPTSPTIDPAIVFKSASLTEGRRVRRTASLSLGKRRVIAHARFASEFSIRQIGGQSLDFFYAGHSRREAIQRGIQRSLDNGSPAATRHEFMRSPTRDSSMTWRVFKGALMKGVAIQRRLTDVIQNRRDEGADGSDPDESGEAAR